MGSPWDPAPVPRGPAGTSYSPRCRNGSGSSSTSSSRYTGPTTQEGYAAGDRALPAGVAGGAPPSTAHAHLAAVLEDAARFRVLDMVRGLGPSDVAHQILNLLFAGLGLFAKLGCVCPPAAFAEARRLAAASPIRN